MKLRAYNASKHYMEIHRFSRRNSLGLALVFFSVVAAGSSWRAPERELAAKVAATIGPGAVSLAVENRSSLSLSDVSAITAELRAQLEAQGMRVVAVDQAAASIEVTLSENVRAYLWVARIQQGTNSSVVMATGPRAGPAATVHESALAVVVKIPVWSQPDQVLDVGVIDSPPRIIVLEPEKVVLYSRSASGQWQQDQAYTISHVRPWPRDLRGRLFLRKDHLFDAYLPGVICSASPGTMLHVQCHESDDPWPLAGEAFPLNAFFSPTRNFFTGVLAPGIGKEKSTAAFFSAATIPRDKYVLWVFAGTDRQLHAVDGVTDLTMSAAGWGSDIAGVKSTCGTGSQILAAGASEENRADTVRAYQFPDRDPVAVSEAVDMGGSVVALWTEQSGNSAVAVSRNLRTGRYEAFRLAISCGQ